VNHVLRTSSVKNFPRTHVFPPLSFKPYLCRTSDKLPFPLEHPQCRIFSRARQGLFMGIKALGLKRGDEILVPAYHHGSEIEALIRAGMVCRYYDIGQRLEPDEKDLESLLNERVRAFSLTHYLGFPQDAARWRNWADKHGLLMIEDAAQAWLSSFNGVPVGSHGDLSIFCLYKSVGVPDGAAVISTTPLDVPRSGRRLGAASLTIKHGMYLEQRWGWFAELHRRLKRVRQRTSPQEELQRDFALGDPEQAPCAVTELLLSRAIQPAVQATRVANYTFLLERLERFVPEPFAHLPKGTSPFVFPIRSNRKEELVHRLARHGIVASSFWTIPHPSLPVADFPQASSFRKSIVGLPVHQELGSRELERIADAVFSNMSAS
jgi:perosamine synthetase